MVIVLFSVIPPFYKWVRRKLVGRIKIDNEAALLDYIIRLANALDGPPPGHPHFLTDIGGSVSRSELNPLAQSMANFMGMFHLEFRVNVCELGEGVAGNVGLGGGGQRVVNIGIAANLLAHSDAVIKVLAHELSHKYLELHGLMLPDSKENELLTDLASIYLGFGAYVVSGSRFEELLQTSTVGYLTQSQCAWAYNVVCELRSDPFARFAAPYSWVHFGDAENYNNFEIYRKSTEKFTKWAARLRESLERAELELCNVEKLCIIRPEFRLERKQEIDGLRNRCVFVKKRLGVIERQVESARERVKPLVAYVVVRSDRLGSRQVNDEAFKLLRSAKALNAVMSSLVSGVDVKDRWDPQNKVVIDCPDCGGHLRVPTGLKHITVTCPKCKYAFDFSTLPPDTKPEPRQLLMARFIRLRQKVEGYEALLCVVAIMICIIISGIYWHSDFHREREAWGAATDWQDDVDGLRHYLKQWPNGRYVDKANERISRIREAERRALDLTSVQAVTKYLSRFPEVDAVSLRAEQYAAISNAPTFVTYRDFRRVLTGTENYYLDVNNTLMGFVREGWHKACQLNTEKGYNAFIDEFEGMKEYTDKAYARIDEFYSDYEYICQKGDVHSFERYLRLHPRGKKSDDIRRRLVLKKIEKVRKSRHAVIDPPEAVEGLKGKLPLCWYSVTNQLPHKIEVLVGNTNFAKGIELESMAGGVILMPTGTYERCVLVRSGARPAYSKSEFVGGVYGEGFHVVMRLGHGRDGEWADSSDQDPEEREQQRIIEDLWNLNGARGKVPLMGLPKSDLDSLNMRRRELEDLRKRYGWPADLTMPPFPK